MNICSLVSFFFSSFLLSFFPISLFLSCILYTKHVCQKCLCVLCFGVRQHTEIWHRQSIVSFFSSFSCVPYCCCWVKALSGRNCYDIICHARLCGRRCGARFWSARMSMMEEGVRCIASYCVSVFYLCTLSTRLFNVFFFLLARIKFVSAAQTRWKFMNDSALLLLLLLPTWARSNYSLVQQIEHNACASASMPLLLLRPRCYIKLLMLYVHMCLFLCVCICGLLRWLNDFVW